MRIVLHLLACMEGAPLKIWSHPCLLLSLASAYSTPHIASESPMTIADEARRKDSAR